MLIRIRRSKDLLLQFQSFECSSLFASNSCVYCTTRYSKCDRIGTKWLFFFTLIEECCAVIERNIDEKLVYRISYQIWYKRYLKGMFGRRVQICEGGPYPLADLDRGGSKSAVTPGRRIESLWSTTSYPAKSSSTSSRCGKNTTVIGLFETSEHLKKHWKCGESTR